MTTSRVTRRGFLQGTAAAITAAGLLPVSTLKGGAQTAAAEPVWPENGTLIPDEGWRLWVDEKAEWKQDAIFLPEDVTQGPDGVVMGGGKALPANAPTGGWSVLTGDAAGSIPVTLPGTVEQHFWGKFGAGPASGDQPGKPRLYTPEEYRYAADDPVSVNGAYFGVSWWWREIEIPAAMQGKRIFLHVRGAHLRAEVYLNEKLVGYSIMEELPFECDLTAAAKPGGENRLAIRITNPFGRFDWVDGLNEQWGAVKLYRSHGFGGLDRGMTISAHDSVRIKDIWVLNTSDARTVQLYVEVEQWRLSRHQFINGIVEATVSDFSTGAALKTHGTGAGEVFDADGAGGIYRGSSPPSTLPEIMVVSTRSFLAQTIICDDAAIWDLNSPKLYQLRASFQGKDGHSDTRTVAFGFRTFAPEGLGANALFRLNGRRMKIYTSISWGYWGINGMWPTPELAVKEVTQAKKLNLTCLNFHRNLAKEDVLRAHDRLGLLRYMEPGAGKMAIGKLPAGVQANAASIVMEKPTDAADKFAQRYMFVKCVEMVKAFRSHPSVIEYCLQNEIGADLSNPDTLAVLEAMRKEDPSRCIVLNDGFVAPPRKAAQAWFEPWNEKLHRSDEEEWGGWWNQHQGAGDQWYDEFYKGPQDFTYKSPERKVISEFGEMEGCATPDNHSLMLHELAAPAATGIGNQPANTSYDLADHREILAAYDKFIDRWGFRAAFPATEKLWTSLGKKCYDTWQNYMENARISDELDFCAISGWETTAIENHSGIVDNLRNFKSDPGPIRDTLLPVRPVAKQRSVCTALGEAATFDLYLLNDLDEAAAGILTFSAVTPSGKLIKFGEWPAPEWKRDQFSYLVKEAFVTPKLTEDGMWRFKFAISSAPLNTQTKEIWVAMAHGELPCGGLFFGPMPPGGTIGPCYLGFDRIAISGISPGLRKQLTEILGAAPQEFVAGEKYDVIISSGITAKATQPQDVGDKTGLEAQPASVVGPVVTTAQLGELAPGILDAVWAGTPLLAIPQADTLSDGVAKQLAAAGAFTYSGNVGDVRAPWMGNWYFVRKHPVYEGLPVDQAMGIHYQAKGQAANGLVIERAPGGPDVEIIAAYSRDHSRVIGAGTFTTKLGSGKVLYHRVPEMHPVMQTRLLANALRWLTS
jgi:beta-galactosidase